MRALFETVASIAAAAVAPTFGLGIGFVFLLSAAVSLHLLWASRIKPEVCLYLANLPNHLGFGLCLGFPLALLVRTLALSAILVPVYILSP
jgi:hypothetical protein